MTPAGRQARTSPRRARRPYHHGDLAAALKEAALEVIERDGLAALTLRGIAQHVGVTQPALYRHYASKDALIAAIATDGFNLLADRFDAVPSGGSAADHLAELGVAYVAFALDHRDYFATMYGAHVERLDDDDLHAAGSRSFRALTDAVARSAAAGATGADLDELGLARAAWSLVHGIATLTMEKELPGPPSRAEVLALTRAATLRLAGAGRRRGDTEPPG